MGCLSCFEKNVLIVLSPPKAQWKRQIKTFLSNFHPGSLPFSNLWESKESAYFKSLEEERKKMVYCRFGKVHFFKFEHGEYIRNREHWDFKLSFVDYTMY